MKSMYVSAKSVQNLLQKDESCTDLTKKEGRKGPWLWISLTGICILVVFSCTVVSQLNFNRLCSIEKLLHESNTDKVVVCYYNTPSQSNPDSGQLLPSSVHPHLCTHLNIAFAEVRDSEISLDENQYKCLKELVKLKQINPYLKILLSVGGSGNSSGFSQMVVNHANRKIFIKSIKRILRDYSLDGIDLDWEFPEVHNAGTPFGKRERQHFSQLLREIRTEYIREKRDYLLSVAVASPKTIVDVSYDVDQLNLYIDYANIMSYDYHYFTKYTPFTGLNSPLYQRPKEQLYMATLNVNYTVQMYLDKGLDRQKIVVGIPTYGHTFTLVNSDNTEIGSPASGYGSLGASGFVNYGDVCNYLKENRNDSIIHIDKDAKVPYLCKDKEWVSFDTPQSVMEKAKFIKDKGLRGAMIYSLNADDYEGICEGKLGDNVRFPLAQSIKNTLFNT